MMTDLFWDEVLLTNNPDSKELEVSFKKIDGDGFITSAGKEPGTPGGQGEDSNGDQGPAIDEDGDGQADGGNEGEGAGGGGSGGPVPGDNPECTPATCPDVDELGYLSVLENSPEALYREGGPNARTPDNLTLSTTSLWQPPSSAFPTVDNWGFQWNRTQNAWGNQGSNALYHLVNYNPSSSTTCTQIVNQYISQPPGDPAYEWYFNVLGLGPLSPCGAAPLSYGVAPLNTGITNSLGTGPWRPSEGEEGYADLQGTLSRAASNSASWVIAFFYDGVKDTSGAKWSTKLCENRTTMILTSPKVSTEIGSAQNSVSCQLFGAGGNARIDVIVGGKTTSIGITPGWNFLNCSVSNSFSGGTRTVDVVDGQPKHAFSFECVSNYSIGGAAGTVVTSRDVGTSFNSDQFWNYALDTAPAYGRYGKCGWGIIQPISTSSNFDSTKGVTNLTLVTTGPYDPNILNNNELNDQIFPGTKKNPDYCSRIQ